MKRFKIPLFIFVVFFLFPFIIISQNLYPKREMRGVWIASVLNIDYPSVPTADDKFLKQEWIKLLEKHQALGINALFVQIRPAADALYPSELSPWSKYLTGAQGFKPANDFDPLEFMISTAHAYGFEFHAWLNPYRGTMKGEDISQLDSAHMLKKRPDWFVRYDRQYIFNPGLPEVRAHLKEIVAEIVRKYNVDAIHFDDYFYPYKNGNEVFDDYAAYNQYGRNKFANLEDWRRSNVDSLIYTLSRTIKSIKPNVQFGISPFGIWRNAYRDPAGSDTFGGSCYDDLYADVLKWMRNDWIDYVAPQIYFTIGFTTADPSKLIDWWARNANGKQVYIGMGAYRVGSQSKQGNWQNPNEIPSQIRLARQTPGVSGAIFFSSKDILRNPLGLADSLKETYFHYPAFHPQALPFPQENPCAAPFIHHISGENGVVKIEWRDNAPSCEATDQFIVYRFDPRNINFEDSRNIIAVVPANKKDLVFYDVNVDPDRIFTYAITSATRHFKESPHSHYRTIKKNKDGTIERLYWMEYARPIHFCTIKSWF